MDKFVKKLIERLEEQSEKWLNIWKDSIKDGDYDKYADGMNDAFIESTEIVNQLAEEYADCYKDCEQCEAYDKENHHCPKFCKVITDALAEMGENCGGWIPCSERLPEEPEALLLDKEDFELAILQGEVNEYNVMVKDATIPTTLYYVGDGYWYDEKAGDVCAVTAWQPLPAPPMICQDAECPYNDNSECPAAEGCAGDTEGE